MFGIEKKFRCPGGDMNHAVLINHGIAVRRERAAQTDIRIKLTILIEIDDAQGIGRANSSACGLEVAAEQTKQSGLAAPVRPHEPHPHSRSNGEVDSRE